MLAMPELLMPGTLLGGRYSITHLAGSGGHSHVYAAKDMKLPGKVWAVKQTLSHPSNYSRSEEEAALLITLDHPRLPRIVDFFPADEQSHMYLVMDYIEGVTLDTYMQKLTSIPEDRLLQIAEQICDGLHYLHTREPPIIYRDLKPSNIMIENSGEVRFIDFGTARSYKAQHAEDTVKLGTVGFAAPEQYTGQQSDARTDMYAVGAILMYVVSGGKFTDWQGKDSSHFRNGVSLELMRVIRKLLSYHPQDRFQSALELKKELSKQRVSKHEEEQAAGRERPVVIAVAGAYSGIGVTHLSVLLAHSLSSKFSRVTLIEWEARSRAFWNIQLELSEEDQRDGRFFSVGNVGYYRKPSRNELIQLLSGGSGLIVMDLGSEMDKEGMEELSRADLQIIMIPGALWRKAELQAYVERLSFIPGNQRVYGVVGANHHVLRSLERILKGDKLHSFPMELNPFEPGEEAIHVIEHIAASLPQVRQKFSRWPFIWGRKKKN